MAEDYTRDVTIRVTETGATAATAALNKTTAAADKLQVETKTLGTRLVESKEQFSAVGGAAFAATSALQSTSGGVTQLLSGLGAITGALSAVPGPLGAVAAGMTALTGLGASVAATFEETGDAAAEATAKVEALRKAYADFQSQLGKGFGIGAAQRLAELQGEGAKVADRRAALLREIEDADKLQAVIEESRREAQRVAAMREATGFTAPEGGPSTVEVRRGAIASQAQMEKYQTQRRAELRAQFEQLAKVEADLQREIDAVTRGEQLRLARPEAVIKEADKGATKAAKVEAEGLGPTLSAAVAAFKERIYWQKLAHDEYLAQLDEQEARDQARWALERSAIAERQARWAAEGAERKALARDEKRDTDETIETVMSKGEAYYQTAAAALVAGENVGVAIKKQLAAEAAAATVEAGWNVLKYTALSLGRWAIGDAAGASAYAQGAALWLGVGAIAGGVAAATGGFGGGAGGGAGGGGLGTGTPSAAEGLRQPEREETRAPVTVNVYTGQALTTRTQIVEAVTQAWVEGTRQRGSPIHGFMGGR